MNFYFVPIQKHLAAEKVVFIFNIPDTFLSEKLFNFARELTDKNTQKVCQIRGWKLAMLQRICLFGKRGARSNEDEKAIYKTEIGML